jgi:hypothetical protein
MGSDVDFQILDVVVCLFTLGRVGNAIICALFRR